MKKQTVTAPVVADAPVAAPRVFSVTETGMRSMAREGLTLQASDKGHKKEWRAKGIVAPSLRAAALAAIVNKCGEKFTAEEAKAALVGVHLGQKTPSSRISAFIRAELIG